MTTLSIIIPAYNEEKTLAACVDKVRAIESADLKLEIILVDDASTDSTAMIGESVAGKYDNVTFIRQKINMGKGAALRTGFERATGDILAVQDADLELNPEDLKKLVRPIIEDRADVVYGSRYLYAEERQVQRFWHRIANKIITSFSNFFTNRYFSDVQTCYKIFRRSIFAHITITEDRFGVDPELTAKFSRLRIDGKYLRIVEMPISYYWRTHDEGKKIGWKDGVRALYVIAKHGLFYKKLE